MIHKFFIVVLFTLFFFESFSQKKELLFENFDINKGLSHNTVHDILQDEKGFLWIGTEDGLNRFDGYNFKVFKKNLTDSFSISDNFITCIYKDSEKNLWFGTNNGGINIYNHLTGNFKAIKSFYREGIRYNLKNIKAISEDSSGNIWLGTSDGLFKLNTATFQITDFYNIGDSDVKLSDNDIRCLFVDKNNILWIGTNREGLNRLDIVNQTIKYYKYSHTNEKSISNNSISYIYRDNADNLWVGTSLGLNLFNKKTDNFKRFHYDSKNKYSISDNDIFEIFEDRKANLWICTLNGLNLYKKDENKFYNWKNDPSQHLPIVDNHIFTIFEDKYDQIWLGSASKGLIKFNNQYKNFTHIKKTSDEPNSLQSNVIREIYEDSNQALWLGYVQGGFDIFSPKTNTYEHYEHDNNTKRSLSSNQIISIFEDSKKNIWIGTWGGGLNKVLGKTGKYEFKIFKHITKDSFSLSDNIIKEVTEDHFGNLWVGTETGINIFNPKEEKSIQIKASTNKLNGLINNGIQSGCIIFEKPDIAWVGTWGGLSKIILSPKTGLPLKFINYVQNDSLQFSINEDRIISMYLDKKRNLWLGTFGGGLNKIVLDDQSEIKSIRYFTEKEGLANNVVYAILEDNSDNLWVSTNNGISKFNPVSEQFINYNEKDGLQSNQFYWGAACKLKSGQLAFGGINGLNLFFPDSISSDNTPAEVVITQITVLNRIINYSKESEINNNTPYADTLNLSYKDYVFSIEFSGLQFVDPLKNKYAYKLDGFDKDWIYTNAQKRYAVYTNLDPGEYVFKVKASNSDFIWNEESTDLVIIIRPPYWKTIWFKILIILLSILALYGIYQQRIASLKKQKNILKKTVKLKTEEIINQNSKLSAINEELNTTNDELFQQKEEMQTTLSKLKDAQNHLVQSEKMASLGVLAAGVAHEINNPLNFIKGGVSALENYIAENLSNHNKLMKPMLGWIETGVERAVVIINGLNHYSRSDSSKREICNIHNIIENCLVMLQNETKNKIDFNKSYTEEKINFNCNEGKMHQVLLNILSNASHSIKEKGTINIFTKIENNTIKIIISDTGYGIKKENIDKIFDPFFTTKAPGEGTGLGLSISQNIIKEHKGTINFNSVEGKGTTVEINFPFK